MGDLFFVVRTGVALRDCFNAETVEGPQRPLTNSQFKTAPKETQVYKIRS
jgi:hypothetical protein